MQGPSRGMLSLLDTDIVPAKLWTTRPSISIIKVAGLWHN